MAKRHSSVRESILSASWKEALCEFFPLPLLLAPFCFARCVQILNFGHKVNFWYPKLVENLRLLKIVVPKMFHSWLLLFFRIPAFESLKFFVNVQIVHNIIEYRSISLHKYAVKLFSATFSDQKKSCFETKSAPVW